MASSVSSILAQKQVYSLEVKALLCAPMASNVSEISRAESRSEPLNSRCSRKWAAPASLGRSSRLPVATQHPTATERTPGTDSVATVSRLKSSKPVLARIRMVQGTEGH